MYGIVFFDALSQSMCSFSSLYFRHFTCHSILGSQIQFFIFFIETSRKIYVSYAKLTFGCATVLGAYRNRGQRSRLWLILYFVLYNVCKHIQCYVFGHCRILRNCPRSNIERFQLYYPMYTYIKNYSWFRKHSV